MIEADTRISARDSREFMHSSEYLFPDSVNETSLPVCYNIVVHDAIAAPKQGAAYTRKGNARLAHCGRDTMLNSGQERRQGTVSISIALAIMDRQDGSDARNISGR